MARRLEADVLLFELAISRSTTRTRVVRLMHEFDAHTCVEIVERDHHQLFT